MGKLKALRWVPGGAPDTEHVIPEVGLRVRPGDVIPVGEGGVTEEQAQRLARDPAFQPVTAKTDNKGG